LFYSEEDYSQVENIQDSCLSSQRWTSNSSQAKYIYIALFTI